MKVLVVLDLNGTILDSTHKRRAGVDQDAMARKKYVYFRPYMHEFLAYLFTHEDIDVAVWTSNIRANAEAIVQCAFQPYQVQQLKFIMSRSDCELGPNYSSFKHVNKIPERLPDSTYDQILIIDDSVATESKIVPRNYQGWLPIPTYQASSASKQYDGELFRMRYLLNAIINT